MERQVKQRGLSEKPLALRSRVGPVGGGSSQIEDESPPLEGQQSTSGMTSENLVM